MKCNTCRFHLVCKKISSFKFYESGHMVYNHEPSLKAIHENVAEFIRSSDNLGTR